MASRKGRPVHLIDGSRSPFLRAKGIPGPFSASDLAVAAARPLLARQPFSPDTLDEVILGCIMPAPDEANIARVVSLRLGCGDQTPAWTVQRNCASGMQAVVSATQDIGYGKAELVLAGGTEVMSHAPLLYNKDMATWLGRLNAARNWPEKLRQLFRFRPGNLKPVIGLLRGLTDPVVGMSMGQTAEQLAWRFNIEREAMDRLALQSHARLAAATDEGRLTEIETVYDRDGNYYNTDDGLRRDGSLEKLARLKPVFDREFGQVTAGNSAQITDGAAWLLLASDKAVRQHNLPVLATIIDSEWAGLSPAQMGLGPTHAMTPILHRRRLALEDIDYWEINEAFAAQVLACLAAWQDKSYCRNELRIAKIPGKLDMDRLNIDGGGISLGHPVGASGARIILHLCHVLEEKNAQRGMASLCVGGGQGGAVYIERQRE